MKSEDRNNCEESSMKPAILPKENLEIYELLFMLEVGLREFLIDTFEAQIGVKWWKQRLPNDVKEASQSGLQIERGAKWSEIVSHHPIYYIDFPDLKKILIRKDNWQDIFQPIFKRQDILEATLGELEPIRNKIAHNRKATLTDLVLVRAAFKKITVPIGEEKFLDLVTRLTAAEDILENINGLRLEALESIEFCQEYRDLQELRYWEKLRRSWWFDADYLGHDIHCIKDYFKTLFEYRKLPRSRGQGYVIEAWVKSNNVDKKFANAIREFDKLLQRTGG